MAHRNTTDRRDFLKGAAAVGAGLALAPDALIASEAPESSEPAEPAEKTDGSRKPERAGPVKLGLIGCGMMGARHIQKRLLDMRDRVHVTAVCDVFTKRLEVQAQRTGAKAYTDYRQLIDARDVDAVLIATPDHWHAKMCIDAADAGKDIYCEKPMTHWRDLGEAKAVVDAVRRNKTVFQLGIQLTSDSRYEEALERVRAGHLGKVMRAQGSFLRNGDHHKYTMTANEPEAVPGKTLDWDAWLGPASKIPYDPVRFAAYRSFFDYSGGIVTDLLPHRLGPICRALGVGFPKRVASTGGKYFFTDRREIPDVVHVTVEYPGGPSLYLTSGMACPSQLPMLIEGSGGIVRFEDDGFVRTDGKGSEVERVTAKRAPGDHAARQSHLDDFIRCVHTRETPRCDAWFGYQTMAVLHMAVHSYLEGKVYEFDEEKEVARAL